jgi:hypothetical protein
MKKHLLTLTAVAACSGLVAQTSILVDLGKPGLQSSAETDPNGYHWNNIAPADGATNGVLGWELLSEEEKAAYTNPGDHYAKEGILPYVAVPDAVDQTGVSTGVSIALTEVIDIADYTSAGGFGLAGLEYGDDLGAIPTQTGYPATATIDSFYINWEFEVVLTVSGLDDAKTYTLRMWGGQANSTRPSSFIVNGDMDGEQTIETFNNTGANEGDFAVFENVSPVNGEITIKYEQGVEDLGTPNGQWSTLEIIGDFGGGGDGTWYDYEVDENGWANTGDWLGWVNVTYDPWIISASLGVYMYISDDSGWVYIPK